MRNVEHWARAVDRRHDVLRVFTFTGNINTANQFLAPFYIARNGILNVRLNLSGEPTKAMLAARSEVRFGLIQQKHAFDDQEIRLERGDKIIVDIHSNLLYGVICGSVPYRDVMYGLGYVFRGLESRSEKKICTSGVAQFERRDMEERMYQDWWAAHGQDYTDGKYTLDVGQGAVYFTSIYPRDLPDIKKRASFLVYQPTEEIYQDPERVECKFDPEAVGQLAPNKDLVEGDNRDLMIYKAINKANEGGIFAAWGCFQALKHNHGVTKEEFAAKVKFLEMGLWSRFKFWLARN